MAAALARHVSARVILSSISKSCILSFKAQNLRHLYGAAVLGLDKYLETREKMKNQFGDAKDKFFQRISQYFNSDNPGMVFTEDLKHVTYLCEDKDSDIELVIKMMKRFNQQNKELRFGTFVFGPVALRLFYHLKKPDIVLQLFKDQELDGFFDQFSSYQIAMDLLFKEQRYQDVVDIFKSMQQKQLYGTKYPRECVVLALGACYKLNSRESYEYALKLIQDARSVGALVLRKALSFAAMLAVNHNEPKVAMELLALTAQLSYITVRNIRMMALADLDRVDDVFLTLRSIIHQDVPMQSRMEQQVCQETVDKVDECLARLGDKEKTHIFEQMKRALRENNHLCPQSLDELLCQPLLTRPSPRDRDVDRTAGSGIGGTYTSGYRAPIKGASGARYPVRHRQGLGDVDD
ncbi:pentatricopeptide repeat-containing protein 2, mitochondrial [Dermacentor silvarum]|nr:pentatricopeptide repeat-containing protein 2, mitochondrial [Dermacentor silvarum]